MKKKKSMVFILAIALLVVCVFVLFSVFGGKEETEALPTEANPASDSASEPEGVTSVGIGDTNTDININQERYRFDDYVTQYEQENDIKLANADDSMKYEFFDDIYAQGYTRANAIEDTESVSKENRELLSKYISYLDKLHESCDFDEAVQEFIESNPDIDLTIDPTPLYEYLLSENIDANDINRNCNNEYRDGYTSWFNRGGSISLSELIPSDELANIQTHERSQEEIDADYEEQERLFQEMQRQSEEEGAQHRAQLTEDLKGMDFDRSETFNF